MGISIKQNHLLKLKYSLHISETVFRILVLISTDTCITVVLQIYTLTLSMPGFQKLAQAGGGGGGGAESAPLLTPLPFIRTKQNFVWANTII